MIIGPTGVEDNGKRRKSNISRFVIASQFEICERGFDELIEEKVRNFLHDTVHGLPVVEIPEGAGLDFENCRYPSWVTCDMWLLQ